MKFLFLGCFLRRSTVDKREEFIVKVKLFLCLFSSVLYISLHCADAFPPNEGHPKDSGKDKGLGFNVNIGWLSFVSINFIHRLVVRRNIFLLESTRYRCRLYKCISSCYSTNGLRSKSYLDLKIHYFFNLVQSRICLSMRWF